MMLERGARKTPRGSPEIWSYLFGTALSFFFSFEGGKGMGFFEPQEILVSS